MKPEHKKQIDDMSYRSMLSLQRFAPIGEKNPLFEGDTYDYFKKVMDEKYEKIGNAGHVAISKELGF